MGHRHHLVASIEPALPHLEMVVETRHSMAHHPQRSHHAHTQAVRAVRHHSHRHAIEAGNTVGRPVINSLT